MLLTKLLPVLLALLFCSKSVWAEAYKTVEWTDLLPQKDLDALTNGPEIVHDTPEVAIKKLVEKIARKNKQTEANSPYDRAMRSSATRPELNKQRIRLVSYIVPLEFNSAQKTTEFFLVPYFGACIHIPPPPPNQLIHVSYPKGFLQEDLQQPYWIEGCSGQVKQDTFLGSLSIEFPLKIERGLIA